MSRLPIRKSIIALAVLGGVLVGIGFYTFIYAHGISYFSSDPRACINCHIMNDQYNSWNKSSHHAAAGCVDCHLPPSGLPKLIAKGSNGWHHSKAFTLQNFHEPIMITPKNAQILQDNCLRCHGDLVQDLVHGATTDKDAVKCVHCHRTVGHGG